MRVTTCETCTRTSASTILATVYLFQHTTIKVQPGLMQITACHNFVQTEFSYLVIWILYSTQCYIIKSLLSMLAWYRNKSPIFIAQITKYLFITATSLWAQWRLKSPVSRLLLFRRRFKNTSKSLAFVRGIHRWLVDSPHKGPVTRKMFPFEDVIMHIHIGWRVHHSFSIKTIADMHTSHIIPGGTRRHGVFDADFVDPLLSLY